MDRWGVRVDCSGSELLAARAGPAEPLRGGDGNSLIFSPNDDPALPFAAGLI